MKTLPPKVLDRREYPAGRVLFDQGQKGSHAYVLEEGEVDIIRMHGDERRVLGRLGPGSIFGEMALIDDKPRMAGAVTVSKCTCLVISREQFQARTGDANPFVQALLRILVSNVRSLAEEH